MKLSQEINELYLLQTSFTKGVYQGSLPKNFNSTTSLTVTKFNSSFHDEVPFKIEYCQAYSKITAILLEQYHSFIENKDDYDLALTTSWWIEYFFIIVKALENDDEATWQEVECFYLSLPEREEYILSIGPIESYSDSNYGIKKFFSMAFARRVHETTLPHLAILFEENINPSSQSFSCGCSFSIKTHYFVGVTIFSAGEVLRLGSRGWSRPQLPAIANKYGTIKIIFKDQCEKSSIEFLNSGIPLLRSLGVREELLLKLSNEYYELFFLYIMLHEFGHTFHKPEGADGRLGKYYCFIEEARADSAVLQIALKLEEHKVLPSNTSNMLLLLILSLFPGRYNSYSNSGLGEEYCLALATIIAWFEKHNIISVKNKTFSEVLFFDIGLVTVASFSDYCQYIMHFNYYTDKKVEDLYESSWNFFRILESLCLVARASTKAA
jgi:hypothetical protein